VPFESVQPELVPGLRVGAVVRLERVPSLVLRGAEVPSPGHPARAQLLREAVQRVALQGDGAVRLDVRGRGCASILLRLVRLGRHGRLRSRVRGHDQAAVAKPPAAAGGRRERERPADGGRGPLRVSGRLRGLLRRADGAGALPAPAVRRPMRARRLRILGLEGLGRRHGQLALRAAARHRQDARLRWQALQRQLVADRAVHGGHRRPAGLRPVGLVRLGAAWCVRGEHAAVAQADRRAAAGRRRPRLRGRAAGDHQLPRRPRGRSAGGLPAGPVGRVVYMLVILRPWHAQQGAIDNSSYRRRQALRGEPAGAGSLRHRLRGVALRAVRVGGVGRLLKPASAAAEPHAAAGGRLGRRAVPEQPGGGGGLPPSGLRGLALGRVVGLRPRLRRAAAEVQRCRRRALHGRPVHAQPPGDPRLQPGLLPGHLHARRLGGLGRLHGHLLRDRPQAAQEVHVRAIEGRGVQRHPGRVAALQHQRDGGDFSEAASVLRGRRVPDPAGLRLGRLGRVERMLLLL